MKRKSVVMVLIVLMLALTLSACGGQKKEELTAEQVVAQLKEKGAPIGEFVVYDAETDPNELLGRPDQYTGKVNFEDTNVEQMDPEISDDLLGGSVEVFNAQKEAKARKAYIDAFSGAPFMAEYSYISGNILLRLDKSLTPEQAAEYRKLLEEITGEKSIDKVD